MAGYSGTPLVKKLGIKPGHRVALLDAPDGFAAALEGLPEDVAPQADLRGEPLDMILLFAPKRADLERGFARAARRLTPAGGLWVAWPKKASGVPTDLTETVVQTIGLDAGLVDNKVCAIDDVWAGLRFVIRRHDRPKAGS
jgi:hypothetical protein